MHEHENKGLPPSSILIDMSSLRISCAETSERSINGEDSSEYSEGHLNYIKEVEPWVRFCDGEGWLKLVEGKGSDVSESTRSYDIEYILKERANARVSNAEDTEGKTGLKRRVLGDTDAFSKKHETNVDAGGGESISLGNVNAWEMKRINRDGYEPSGRLVHDTKEGRKVHEYRNNSQNRYNRRHRCCH